MESTKNTNLKIKKWPWENWAITLISLTAFIEMTWLSVRRALGLNALWFDLGTMTQSIHSALSGSFFEYTSTDLFVNISRFSGHVEIIYFFFVPIQFFFPGPISLLITQVLLYTSGGVAFYLIGRDLKNAKFGLWLAVFYLWYPVAQSAVLFDFHGDTIAMPFIAWMLYAFNKKSWKAYYTFLILALLCKVYIAIPIAVFGILLWYKNNRKHGLRTFLLAAGWCCFAFFVVRGFFVVDIIQNTQGYISLRILDDLDSFFTLLRVITLIVIIVPIIPYIKKGFFWLFPDAAIALPAFMMHGYSYTFHHYAAAVPFIIYAISMVETSQSHDTKKSSIGILTLGSALLLNFIFIIYVGPLPLLISKFPTNAPKRALSLIPWINEHIDGSIPIAASPNLSPWLATRPEIYQTFMMQSELDEPVDLAAVGERSDYFVVDSLFETETISRLEIEKDVLEFLTSPSSAFDLLAVRDGVFIFEKTGVQNRIWIDKGTSISDQQLNLSLENGLKLISTDLISSYSDEEWALTFTHIWEKSNEQDFEMWYGITSLEGYQISRSLHLGTWVISPPSEWVTGTQIQENVYLNIPHSPGCYPIKTGFYDPNMSLVAGEDDALIGKSVIWGYWLMDEEVGEGTLVEKCPTN